MEWNIKIQFFFKIYDFESFNSFKIFMFVALTMRPSIMGIDDVWSVEVFGGAWADVWWWFDEDVSEGEEERLNVTLSASLSVYSCIG